MLTVCNDIRYGNFLKGKWLLDHRRIDHRWIDGDVIRGRLRLRV
jgi:hypothetical protein